jgi:DeoR/GlpR family transcriptional regulator of sugar metabolism
MGLDKSGDGAAAWTFLTNHAHVLLLLAQNPDRVLREVAQAVGITERAVQRIVAELEESGYLHRHKEGRKNVYAIDLQKPLRHPIESHCTIGMLIAMISEQTPRRT